MKVTVKISDAVIEKIWQANLSYIEKQTDEWEKAKMSIWSKEEVLVAHIQTLLQFEYDDRIIFKEKE